MTPALLNTAGHTLRPCVITRDNMDGTLNVIRSGYDNSEEVNAARVYFETDPDVIVKSGKRKFVKLKG